MRKCRAASALIQIKAPRALAASLHTMMNAMSIRWSDVMISWLKNRLGWSTPQMPVFERALLAVRLGHGRSRCLAHKQGRCPGTD